MGLAAGLIHLPDKPAGVFGVGGLALAGELIHLPGPENRGGPRRQGSSAEKYI